MNYPASCQIELGVLIDKFPEICDNMDGR